MKSLNQSGVTIIEILVVVAIISLLFVVTASFLQNYFGKESFRQTTQLLVGDFNNVIHEVRLDVAPQNEGVVCYKDVMGDLDLKLETDAKPGEHKDCALFGKAVQLGISDSVTTTAEDYIIYDLIALSDERTNARTLENFQVFHKMNVVDTSKVKKVPQGGGFIKTAYFETGDPPPNDKVFLDGFAIVLSQFGAELNSDGSGDFIGGSRRLSLWAIYPHIDQTSKTRSRLNRGGFENNTKHHALTSPSTMYYHPLPAGEAIFVCLESGVGEEWAFIRIGSNQGALEAEVERDYTTAEDKCKVL